MPTVSFTPALRRFLNVPQMREVAGATTVGAALAAAFAECPGLRGYVLDDQGALRRHVNIYVGGESVHDRAGLSDPVGAQDEICVFQVLTGG
jgi:sulfur-carrier protein